MDYHELLATLSALVLIAGIRPYYLDITKGTSRPSFVSFSLWTILGVIEVAAQYAAGTSWTIVLNIILTASMAFFTLLTIRGYGYQKVGTLDYMCIVIAVFSLVGWYVTHNPLVALILALTASIVAAIPTIVKTYHDPYSEFPLGWFLVFVGSVLSIGSTTLYNLPNLIIPIYTALETATIATLAFVGQRSSPHRDTSISS